ncbi:phage major capsid protein [Rhodopseudomonas palustris]|uniref:phage major capsid protein n=1 Tax=Rhodopseudomonas palustris TaxID=1076 RepID=UPI0022F1401E|nr:phage major capsid protein [Rhodopseudomonas palustris]WBU27580.1 phage major capsid protein [Rhodopseudomonas palustris]
MNKQFGSLAEFLVAVLGSGGEVSDRRLQVKSVATGQYEGGGSAGGYLVPDDIALGLWSRVYDTGRILARCDEQMTSGRKAFRIPAIKEGSRADGSRFGGARMIWTDEGGSGEPSGIDVEQLKLELKKLLGLIYATDELLEDGPALQSLVERLFALEAAFAIEDGIVNGNGVGKPLGIMKSGALIVVAPEAGQAAGSVTRKNLVDMASRLWGPSHRDAIWLMGNDIFAKIVELEEELGLELFTEGAAPGSRLLLQMPVELCEYTSPIGSSGDLMLCDFSQYLLIKNDPQMLSSIHVSFDTDETAFKTRYRVDGQPAWATPITPKNSDNTQSPFIALGERK